MIRRSVDTRGESVASIAWHEKNNWIYRVHISWRWEILVSSYRVYRVETQVTPAAITISYHHTKTCLLLEDAVNTYLTQWHRWHEVSHSFKPPCNEPYGPNLAALRHQTCPASGPLLQLLNVQSRWHKRLIWCRVTTRSCPEVNADYEFQAARRKKKQA